MKKQLLTTVYLFLIIVIGYGQQPKLKKVSLTKIKKTEQKESFENVLISNIEANSGTEFKAVKRSKDKLNQTHTTYQQYYRGIKVEMGTIKLHQKNSDDASYNGAHFDMSGVHTTSQISEQQAIAKAKSYFNNGDVFWLTESGFTNDPLLSIQMVILPNKRKGDLNLAYAIGIGTFSPTHKMGTLYINAIDGSVLKFKNQILACFEDNHKENSKNKIQKSLAAPIAAGTGFAAYTGSVSFETTLDGTNYVLNDETRATGSNWNLSTQGLGTKTGIITLDMRTGTDYINGPIYEFTDNDNNWTPAEMITDDNVYAIDVHWGSELIYDFWKNENSWNSYNGNNSALMSLVHYDKNLTNAAWGAISNTTGIMLYGDGAGSYTPLTTLDVVAHEIAHGVNNATSNLDYEFESGALNEGLSDIWAMVIENYANDNHGTSTDPSKINDQNAGGALRSFSNPNAYNQPDTYGGTYWYDITNCTPDKNTNDYCGVHTNSGVLNYWFWLLHNGGSGTNDIGDAYDVTAIDVYDAADIVWQMQTNYLTSTSDYADARDAAIQAATDLFSSCAQEVISVTNAFYAVGVGSEHVPVAPTITTQPSGISVAENGTAQFTIAASDYTNVYWYVSENGGAWSTNFGSLTHSGENTTTLTLTNVPLGADGFRFRAIVEDNCGEIAQSNIATLNVIEYTLIPDANFESALNALGLDDIPGDGKVPTALIEVETELDVTGKSISDVTGIEDFVSLETLSFQDNNITSIDVSNLTQLTYLNVSDNDITNLDLSNNVDLEILVSRLNPLTSLNVDTNVVLQEIHSRNCNITSIDITKNPDVTLIRLNDNDLSTANLNNGNNPNITDLDLTGNSNLTCILIDDITYIGANWNIDAQTVFNDVACSMYTAIPDPNFEAALDALGLDDISGDGQVPTALIAGETSLEVKRKSITNLTGIEDFRSLVSLTIGSNNITTLDLSSVTTLESLDAANAGISSLNISGLTQLKTLLLGLNNLTSIDLSAFQNLEDIYLNNNDLNYLDLRSGANTNISTLELRGNSNLTCVFVDDASYSALNWNFVDNQTIFREAYCDYTIIPDANFEAALYALGLDDVTGDGQVPTALIEVETVLDVTGQSISDLTGIEDFTALETLVYKDNTVATIDLSNNTNLIGLNANNNGISSIDISANTALDVILVQDNNLTSLDVSNNTALSRIWAQDNQINTLDVSNNPLLRAIGISNSNLTTLDLSNNIVLEQLYAGGNALTEMDLSNHSVLRIIGLDHNNLESLNVKNGNNTNVTTFVVNDNPNLTCIVVDDADWSTNNWTVDAQTSFWEDEGCGYTQIPDANFEAALDALGLDDITGDGQVPTALIEVETDLDISNQSISDLTGIEGFTALIELDCSRNNLTSLNIANNTVLTILNSERNDLTSIDVSNNTVLLNLGIRSNDISVLDVSNNIHLTHLDIRGNNSISQLDLSQNIKLTTLICNFNNISSLDLSNNTELTHLIVDRISSLSSINLSTTTKLETLTCYSTNLSSLDVSNCTALKNVDIRDNNFTTLDFSANVFLESVDVRVNNDLTSLNIKNQNNANITNFNATSTPSLGCIIVDDANNIPNGWSTDSTGRYTDTNCRYTVIPDANFEAALYALGLDNIIGDGQVPTALIEAQTNVDVSGQSISDLTGIEDFTALKVLWATDNSITSYTFTSLPVLAELRLQNNGLTSIDVSNITTLEDLRVSGNTLTSIDVSNLPLLETFIADENIITSFDFSNNPDLVYLSIFDNAITNLDLSANLALERVFVNDNNLSSIDLSNNALLKLIYCDDNNLSALDLSSNLDLQELRAQNNNLTSLDLSNNSKLTYVRVPDNLLTSIDVSNSTLLTLLNVERNSLSGLDVSNNTSLEKLYTATNVLVEVDLSNNTNLIAVGVNDNNLETLNVKNGNNTNITTFVVADNPNLTCVLVNDIAYATAKWVFDSQTSFSDTYCKYTAIPDVAFEQILESLSLDDISQDGLVPTALIEDRQYLSLGHATHIITDLTGIEDFTDLEGLYADGHAITTADFSNNVNLIEIYIKDSPLTSINVTANTNLDVLATDGTLFTTIDLSTTTALGSLELHNSKVTSLDVSNNTNLRGVYTTGSADLVDLDLSGLQNLTGVNVSNCNLSSLDISNGFNSNIRSFDARTNPNLTCILVDDINNIPNNWNKDVTANYNVAYCRYTAIPDPDFEQILYAEGLDDTLLDGKVPTALIETEVSLVLDYNAYSIKDLTGIEDFIALKNLYGEGNAIASADFSNNTNLIEIILDDSPITSLNITSNSKLQSLRLDGALLTTIDVSNNSALRFLYVQNSGLTSLDLDNNTNLERIYVDGNALVNVDFSVLKKLESVDVSDNNLSTLNIKNGFNSRLSTFNANTNVDLSCILIDDVNSIGNRWSKDVTASYSATYCQYTAIPDANFEAVLNTLGLDDIVGDGQVPTELIETETILNVRSENIADLTGIEDFTALVELDCRFNLLTTLNVTQNIALEKLSFAHNSIVAIDLFNNLNLKILDCFSNYLTALDVSQNTLLEWLDCDSNQITAIDLSANSLLTYLDIYNNALTGIDISSNLSLEQLYLSENSIGTLDLSSHTLLEDIECEDCGLTSMNIKNGNNTAIGYFNVITNPDLTCILVNDIAYATANWTIDPQTSFTDTNYCRYTTIPDANFEAALDAIGLDDVPGDGQVPTALIEVETLLDVKNSNISDLTGIEDFIALELFGFNNNTVSSIDLSNNTLLRVVVCNNNNLSSLDVSSNLGLKQLQAQNNNLTSLDLSNNSKLTYVRVPENLLTSIDVSNSTSLKFLNVQENSLSSLDVSNNPHLEKLFAATNSLVNVDLSNNANLTIIGINDNNLESLNAKNGNNTSITTFVISDNPDLTCVLVDDIIYATANWIVDAQTSFTDTNYCRYTAIPDTNFETALDALGLDDIAGDGQVPTALIEGETALNVNNESISDLTGIEDFVSLTTLNAGNNSLNSLVLSTNTNLIELVANNNALTTIDITQNGLLEFINLRDNLLTSIDLGNKTNLKDLEIDANNLQSLDVSTNTLLIQIAADNNAIASLDLTNNTALLNLSITHNGLETLIVGTNAILRNVEVNDNAIETLDLDGASALDLVDLFNNNLKNLSIQNGNNSNLRFLNTTGNTNLDCITVDDAMYSGVNWSIDAHTSLSDTSCDTIAPVITLVGVDPATVELGDTYVDQGATASDNYDGDITANIVIVNSVNTSIIGTYTITYNVTDAAGNAAIEVTRTVNVVDTTAPIITLNGANPQTIELGEVYIELGATTDDGSTVVIDASAVDANTAGSYAVTYNATDVYGNTATQVIRTVNIVARCPITDLPIDNFIIQAYSETCSDKNNGTVLINASEELDYITTVNGITYEFSSNLFVTDLAPGTYPICIAIKGYEDCEQCFEAVIEEAPVLTGKTTLDTNASASKVFVEVESGTAPYTVMINDEEMGVYTTNSFYVDVNHGDKVDVLSSVACEGKLSKSISLFDSIRVYPNPTRSDITLMLPSPINSAVRIEIHNALGVRVALKEYSVVNGSVVMPMSHLSTGVYFVTIVGDRSSTLRIVKE